MQFNLIMQKNNENTLMEQIVESFAKKPKKVYFLFGNLKESGFKMLEEELYDSSAKFFFAIGIDKKNTTRTMLDSILNYSKDVYYYSNNGLKEFVTNICIFEYNSEAYLFISSSNMSESGMKEDLSVYTKITLDLTLSEDKLEYKNQVKELMKIIEKEAFLKLNKTTVEKLVEEKEIFTTRQYNHSVKSISELLGKIPKEIENKKEMSKEEIDDVYVQDTTIPKIDLSDIKLDLDDIDISAVATEEIDEKKEQKKEEIEVTYDETELDQLANTEKVQEFMEDTQDEIEDEDEIDVENELYDASMADEVVDTSSTIDINSMLFSKADVKLEIEDKKSKKEQEKKESTLEEEEELVQVKKVNLNHVTNFIFELPSRATKEQDWNMVKIPNYIRTMIPEFFGLNDKAKNVEIDGITYKVKNIKLELIDVKMGAKYTDREAKIMYKSGQTYLTVSSNTFKNVLYDEKDIMRMIKLADDIYHIEIISKEMQEYKLWSKICGQNFKSSTRKYGMM